MRAHRHVLLSLCVSILSLSAACVDPAAPTTDAIQPPGSQSAQTVTLSPTQLTLSAGGHMVITATPTGKDGKPITAAIKWTSSD
ncbi:MAG TPA: hypothetical protein VFJ96_10115, partial [Gemmatimonadaceae bacterium]|nr:hypothetical protein [Gemmatimonadaceae bacterium]